MKSVAAQVRELEEYVNKIANINPITLGNACKFCVHCQDFTSEYTYVADHKAKITYHFIDCIWLQATLLQGRK